MIFGFTLLLAALAGSAEPQEPGEGLVYGQGHVSAADNLRLYLKFRGWSAKTPRIVLTRSVGPLELTGATATNSRDFFLAVTLNNPTDDLVCVKAKGFIVPRNGKSGLSFSDTWSLYGQGKDFVAHLAPHSWLTVRFGKVDIMDKYLPEGGPLTEMFPHLEDGSRYAIWKANPVGSPKRCFPVPLEGYDSWLIHGAGDMIQKILLP